MVLVLLLEFAAAITVAVLRPNIEQLLQKNMNETMQQYGNPKDLVTKTWDDLQRTVSVWERRSVCVGGCGVRG